MNKTVAVLRCDDYQPELIKNKLREAWELSGGKDVLDVEGKRVLLKPNVLLDSDIKKAATTHPEFFRAAIRLMKELGAAQIIAGDSPGFPKPGFKAKGCGLWDVCIDENIRWWDFLKKSTTVTNPDGQKVRKFTVTDAVDNVDIIISLPKLKTHQLMYFTGAIKNQFGMIPGLLKSSFHMMLRNRADFAAMIVDLHQSLKPDFAFMDGIVSMEGPGPGNGFPKKTDLVLASSNLLAMDITACRIIGYDPDIIPVISNAVDRGVWLEDSHDVEIAGLSLSEAKVGHFQKIKLTGSNNQLKEFITPGFLKRLIYDFGPKPVFREKQCIRCEECIKICPADALTLTKQSGLSQDNEKMISIDYDKCIRCFCCHEVCPEDAIAVKRTLSDNGVIR
ncbi:MAG TPA: FeS-binding protein [Spirochaeta sp.]|nr:FeS-binding protein [Spirochaeta sp.]